LALAAVAAWARHFYDPGTA